jgi:hypothetical protein
MSYPTDIYNIEHVNVARTLTGADSTNVESMHVPYVACYDYIVTLHAP